MIAPLDGGLELIMHLGMTGSFSFGDKDAYARAILVSLDDGRELVFRDPRRFGRLAVVDAGDYATIPTLHHLGPEPLSDDFDPERFAAVLAQTSGPDQTVPPIPESGSGCRQHLRGRSAVEGTDPSDVPTGRAQPGRTTFTKRSVRYWRDRSIVKARRSAITRW